MKKINHYKLVGLLLTLLFSFGAMNTALAADVNKLVKDKCADCHEEDGNSTNEFTPSIAGISVDYFTESMEQYGSDDRPAKKLKDKDEDMKDIVKDLSEEDIEALATYFSEQTFKPRKQEFDASLVKAGKKLHRRFCDKCHSEGGTSSEDDAGILAGQPIPYLQYTMDNYSSGKREMGKKMAKKFKKMKKKAGDEGITQLIHYYASQQ